MQIPIVSPAEAAALASKYHKQGFKTLKLKVGKNLKSDMKFYKQYVRPTLIVHSSWMLMRDIDLKRLLKFLKNYMVEIV